MAPGFKGGALSFKGDKKAKKKKKKSDAKHTLKHQDGKAEDGKTAVTDDTTKTTSVEEKIMASMTEAEKKAYKRKKERERLELEKVARKSHRERVEDFNEKLSQLTEHNDLPRVSAAGNG